MWGRGVAREGDSSKKKRRKHRICISEWKKYLKIDLQLLQMWNYFATVSLVPAGAS
jgi:hypothetical protein